jgi:hypothetical protein
LLTLLATAKPDDPCVWLAEGLEHPFDHPVKRTPERLAWNWQASCWRVSPLALWPDAYVTSEALIVASKPGFTAADHRHYSHNAQVQSI